MCLSNCKITDPLIPHPANIFFSSSNWSARDCEKQGPRHFTKVKTSYLEVKHFTSATFSLTPLFWPPFPHLITWHYLFVSLSCLHCVQCYQCCHLLIALFWIVEIAFPLSHLQQKKYHSLIIAIDVECAAFVSQPSLFVCLGGLMPFWQCRET